MSSSTIVIELADFGSPSPAVARTDSKQNHDTHDLDERTNNFGGDGLVVESAVTEVEQWNNPKINIARLGAAFWGFIIMGANDAAVGVSEQSHVVSNDMLRCLGFDSICKTITS
jgi:hypothetical protein